MLSLHGASVVCGPTWGKSYDLTSEGFPYPAWLVQPTNRFHWGTDWEGPGYDDGLAALAYVDAKLPGANAALRPKLGLDMDRILMTGHSMGGHGCFVFSVHNPDRLLASLCAAPWTSQMRYVQSGKSPLADIFSDGVMKARMAEHAADFLAMNIRGVPLKVVYGSRDDNVPPQEPRYMAELVDAFNGKAGSTAISEIAKTGHWFGQNAPEVANFLREHLVPRPGHTGSLPLPSLPQTFEFTVPSVSSFGTKGNLKVLQLSDAARPGKFFVRRCATVALPSVKSGVSTCAGEDADGAGVRDALWYIDTSNVRRFRFLDPPFNGRQLPQTVVVDGSEMNVSEIVGKKHHHLCLVRLGKQGVLPLWKVCKDGTWEKLQRDGPQAGGGPYHNVLRRAKLCIAHGSGEGLAGVAVLLANKLYFISRYAVPVVDATPGRVNVPSVCQAANMIFLGHPEDNALLDRDRCAFPYVTFHNQSSSGFTLAGRVYKGAGVGLIGLGHLSNGRLGLVLSGTDGLGILRASDRVPVSSFRDGADYLVLGSDAGWKGDGGALAGGYLDHLWRPSPTSSWAEPEHSVASGPSAGFDGAPADARCTQVQADLLQSDAEIRTLSGAAACVPITFLAGVAFVLPAVTFLML